MAIFRILRTFIFLVTISSTWSRKGNGRVQDSTSEEDFFRPFYRPFVFEDMFKHFNFDKEFQQILPEVFHNSKENSHEQNGIPGSSNELLQGEPETLESRYFNLFTTRSNGNRRPDFDPGFGISQMLNSVGHLCPKDTCFAGYNPDHSAAVSALSSVYNDQFNMGALIDISSILQAEVHPQAWYISMIRAQLAHHPSSLNMIRPHPFDIFPSRFFPIEVLSQNGYGHGHCRVLDGQIGVDNGEENNVWYFREDVLLNSHHWIWHLLNPVNSTSAIDRRGELFYFFHHELIARYTAERLSNHMPEPIPINIQFDTVVEEGYNPHLIDGTSTRPFAPRAPYTVLEHAVNETGYALLSNLILTRDRVVDTIFSGSVFLGDRDAPIHTVDNINPLGDIVEASLQSANPDFYGYSGYHTDGHLLFGGLIGHYPLGSIGVMGDQATSMRDPIFYRWHKLVDILFQTYKATHLAPYDLFEGENALVCDGIAVKHLEVVPDTAGGTVNVLNTYWNTKQLNLEGGLDFNSINASWVPNLPVCASHLDHEEFTYKINILNNRHKPAKSSIRIFLAPRYKSKGGQRFTVNEQRLLFFSMDSFTTILKPGANVISRSSIDSTLTVPWPKSIQQLRREIEAGLPARANCECGYPHHLLLPKGTEEGMVFDLFVMVTDAAKDVVPNIPIPQFGWRRPPPPPPPHIQKCIPSHIHCGVAGRLYPDSKPMGYPFDRRAYSLQILDDDKDPYGKVHLKEVETLEDYVAHVPNMGTTQIIITHKNINIGPENIYR